MNMRSFSRLQRSLLFDQRKSPSRNSTETKRRKDLTRSSRLIEAPNSTLTGGSEPRDPDKLAYAEKNKDAERPDPVKGHDNHGKETPHDGMHGRDDDERDNDDNDDDDDERDNDPKHPDQPKPPGPHDPPIPEPPAPTPDDRINEAEIRALLSDLFRQQYAFADSYSDYGSRAAILQQTIGASDAPPVQPAWSGVTFSNANFNWQIGLRRSLGIKTPTVDLPGLPAEPFYALANPYVGQLPTVPKGGGSSYAIGGATTGTLNLFEILAPEAANAARIAGTGMQAQIQTALQVGEIELDSRTLSVVWGGGNNLLVGEQAGASLASTLDTILEQLRDELIALVRNGGGRQVLLGALAPLQGSVDGVAYQMPFLTDLLAKAEAASSGSYLKEWLNLINNGGIQEFQASVLAMVEEVQAMYPYANLMGFIPEYQSFSREFGKAYGKFSDYGIKNTLSYAQLSGSTPDLETDSFLYFDSVHATKSGQVMLERGIELTLIREIAAIRRSTLAEFQIGNSRDNILTGGLTNDGIRGGAGRDRIAGRQGWDDLRGDRDDDVISGGRGNDKVQGGLGSDILKGNRDADFFQFKRSDANGRDVDTIADFKPQKGDRLGIATVLDPGNLFEGSQWIYIGSNEFTGSAGELRYSGNILRGDVDGDGNADLQIRLPGVATFNPDLIS